MRKKGGPATHHLQMCDFCPRAHPSAQTHMSVYLWPITHITPPHIWACASHHPFAETPLSHSHLRQFYLPPPAHPSAQTDMLTYEAHPSHHISPQQVCPPPLCPSPTDMPVCTPLTYYYNLIIIMSVCRAPSPAPPLYSPLCSKTGIYVDSGHVRRPHLSSHLHRCVFHPSVPISQTDMRTCEAHSLTCLHMCVTYVPPPLPKQTCGHACDEAHPPLTCPHECLPRPLPSTNAEDVRPTPRRSPLLHVDMFVVWPTPLPNTDVGV